MPKANLSKGQWVCCGINILLFIVGVFLVILGLVLELKVVPDQVKSKAKEDVIIKMDSSGTNGLNEFTNDWLHQNYTVYMQYYFYNYSNTMSIIDMGAKPDMFEVGPYSYRETTIYNYKVPDSFSKDGTEFTYTKTTKYEFDPATSCQGCTENDTFIMPDILFFKFADVLLDPEAVCTLLSSFLKLPVQSNCLDGPLDGELKTLIDLILRNLLNDSNFEIGDHPIELFCELLSVMTTVYGGGPFLPIKVHEILWDGYHDPIVSRLINEILKFGLNITLPDITIPIFINYKEKTSLSYTMNTGINDYLQTGFVLLYNDSKTLPDDFWNGWQCHANDTDSCIPPQHLDIMDLSAKAFASEASTTSASNCECEVCSNETASLASKLKGTTGDFFHALIEKSDRLSVLVDDICRTMDFIYQEESKVQDIDTYRFIIDPSMFSSSDHDNCGYCRQLTREMYGREAGSYCLPDGLLDLSGCEQLNADIVVSNPHFYGAAKEVRQMFPYLKQDPIQDQTTLDIEPTTGTVLAANKRLQINYLFKNYPGPFGSLTSGVYPILWLNESYMMDPHTHDQIKSEVINPQHLAKLLCYIVGVGLGSALIVVSIISTIVNLRYFTKRRITIAYFDQNGVASDPYETKDDLDK